MRSTIDTPVEISMNMKFLVFLTIAAVVGSSLAQPEKADDTKPLKQRFNELIDQLKQIGKDTLASAAQQALAAGKATLIDLLLKLEMEHIAGGLGKRSLKEDVLANAADLFNKVSDAIKSNAAKAIVAYEQAMDKLKATVEKMHESDFVNGLGDKVNEIKAEIENIMKEHNIVMRSVEDDMESDISRAAKKAKLGKKIADFFKPHIDTVKGHLQTIGDLAKTHATNIHSAAKVHINDLADKMMEHGKTLVGHGKTAVDQLKEAVTDILNETFKNMAGTIKDAIDTGKDSINTITDHVAGAVEA
ncbi:uncharacterized protein LOC141912142 [Tubulanus polymorphus]|uniref:uncharacterized protein LOC141912142 n=1 Tax=Tubulanus polymorphus TaxID=672921 RepID=UPI003DA6A63F